MKKCIISFILLALIFSTVPALAETTESPIASVKIQINGVLVDTTNSPIPDYSYANYNFAKLIIEAMGGTMTFNTATNTIIITSGQKEDPQMNQTLATPTPTEVLLKAIKIEPTKVTLKTGESLNLTVRLTPEDTVQKQLTYITNNKNIATIDGNGKITGVGAGKATITVYSPNKKIFAKCNVIVSQLAATFEPTPTPIVTPTPKPTAKPDKLTPDGISSRFIEDDYYVSIITLNTKWVRGYNAEKEPTYYYYFDYQDAIAKDKNTQTSKLIKQKKVDDAVVPINVMLEDIPIFHKFITLHPLIKYDYYVNTILPLIK
jgi:hypothetical protein